MLTLYSNMVMYLLLLAFKTLETFNLSYNFQNLFKNIAIDRYSILILFLKYPFIVHSILD